MAYIDQVIGSEEKPIAIAYVHWFHMVKGAFWFFVPLLLWAYCDILLITFIPSVHEPVIQALSIMGFYVFGFLTIAGAVMFFMHILNYIDTELGLTDKRVLYKTGLIFIDVLELDLEEIKAADLDTGMLGAFLGYAFIFLDSRFVGNMNTAMIADPYPFIQKLNKAREQVKDSSMRVILNEQAASKNEVKQTLESAVDQGQKNATRPSPHKKTRLHDKILQSFSLANWRKKD